MTFSSEKNKCALPSWYVFTWHRLILLHSSIHNPNFTRHQFLCCAKFSLSINFFPPISTYGKSFFHLNHLVSTFSQYRLKHCLLNYSSFLMTFRSPLLLIIQMKNYSYKNILPILSNSYVRKFHQYKR